MTRQNKALQRLAFVFLFVFTGTMLFTPATQAASFYRIPIKTDGLAPGAGTLTMNPGSVAFADSPLGSTSAPQTATLVNAGNTDVAVEPPSISGPFSVSAACPPTLGATRTCSYSVTFSPQAMGSLTGTLSVPTSAGVQTVLLSGYGLQTAESTNIGSLSFEQAVGTTSSARAVTLINTGNTPIAISAVTVNGQPFAVSHNCPSVLTGGASCDANVTFAPTQMGATGGTLEFATAAGTERVVLSGLGLLAVPQLSKTTLTFGDQNVNTTSAAQI